MSGPSETKKVAFLFPGQGAQFVGMCKELHAELPAVRDLFDRAEAVLGFDLKTVCFEGPAETLEATDISQPAIFVASLAALESLKATRPELVESAAGAAGLSLGEYTALVFAGSIDFETALRVVRKRGQLMQAAAVATPSGMSSILGLDEAKVDAVIASLAPIGRLWKANMLGPGNIVVSGEKPALASLEAPALEAGAMKVIPLAVAGAFHSPLMKPADERLAEVLAGATIVPSRIPVYANVDTTVHSDPDGIRQRLVDQVTGSVLWEGCVRKMMADGFDSYYEIGPGRVLTGLMKRIDRKTPCEAIPAR
ncbi:ACP S-malonyltransferase [bacterium]|nr:ACP S-malonyltransferase [bacterium]